MKSKDTGVDYSMDFEFAMRQFFGDKAYSTASGAFSLKFVKPWLLRATRKMMKDVEALDSTARHKEMLMSSLERIRESIKNNKNEWEIIFHLFFLCSRFLGYDWIQGARYHIPFYSQTKSQYYWSKRNNSKKFDPLIERQKDEINVIRKQKEIIEQLNSEGYDDFHVSLILGMSEYQVKQVK